MTYIPPQPQPAAATPMQLTQVTTRIGDAWQSQKDVMPATLAIQGAPIPIVYGWAKLPLLMIEKQTPLSQVAPRWQASTQYWIGMHVCAKTQPFVYNEWVCVQNGVSGTEEMFGFTNPEGKNVTDGTAKWNFVANVGMDEVNLLESPQTVTFQIFAAVICEGEISGADGIWIDKLLSRGNDTSLGYNLQCLHGPDDLSQTVPVLFDSCGYQHSALVTVVDANGMPTGTQTEMPNLSAVIFGVMFGAAPRISTVSPADIINDLVTHSRRGCGMSSGIVDTSITGTGATTFRTYCAAAGFHIAMVIDSKRTALSIMAEIFAATNADAFWSQGKIKAVPLGDVAITDPVIGSTNYVPNTTPIYNFGPDDFLDRDNPVQIKRVSQADCFNAFPVEYTDQMAGFTRTVVEDPDQADIDARGLFRAGTTSLGISYFNGDPAVRLSRIMAQRSMTVRCTYSFKVGWKYIRLEPCDIVTLTDDKIGIYQTQVRVVSIDESPEGITVQAEDYPPGVNHSITYTPQSPAAGYQPNEIRTTQSIWSMYDGRHSADYLRHNRVGGNNIAYNSTFITYTNPASSPDGWAPYGFGATCARITGRNGGYACRTTNVAEWYIGLWTNLTEDWLPNETYVVSWWAKTGATPGAATGKFGALKWNVAPSKTENILNPALTSSWQRYAIRITWGSSVETLKHLYIAAADGVDLSAAQVDMDDVVVVLGHTVSEWKPSAPELLPEIIQELHVAPAAITATKIGESAVGPRHVNSVERKNSVTPNTHFSIFSLGTSSPPDGWENWFYGVWGTNISAVTSPYMSGGYSIQIDSSATSGAKGIRSRRYPAVPGDWFEVEAWIRADRNTASDKVIVWVMWFDAADSYLSTDGVFYAPVTTINTWQKVSAQVVGPASAAYARVIVGAEQTGGFTTWVDSCWTTHVIKEEHIGSGAVVEAKIGSLAVTVGKIGNGAVEEAKIATGAVTENKLGALAVTSAKIGSNAITAPKIADAAVGSVHVNRGDVRRYANTNARVRQWTRG